ncbi:ADP-ribosylation factor [Aplysia californica]|uniref:ADP-ribosylation factor n=1 Tax=Aplysia californica TaxID=6500 RepID=A0ABM0JQF5_APLCA|nr:ADP-ribosylation factor [Aplysia californica]
MGAWICKRTLPDKILIQGLDAAGKTQLLYQLKLGEAVITIPTIGFNVETVTVSDVQVMCFDIGGRDKMRSLVRHYYRNAKGMVYLIDSADRDRLGDALDELFKYYLHEDETRESVVMILANKQDKPGALTVQEVEDAFRKKYSAEKFGPNHTVFVKPCSAWTGDGIWEAFECFVSQIELRKSGKVRSSGLITVPDRNASNVTDQTKSLLNFKSALKDPLTFVKSWLFY